MAPGAHPKGPELHKSRFGKDLWKLPRSRRAQGEEWRECMGIEPTGPAVHEAQPALKAGRHTSTDPLPQGERPL